MEGFVLRLTPHEESAFFEHRFWLQILGDHSRFILNTLSPTEEKDIERAGKFITIFDRLLEQAREPLSEPALNTLTHSAMHYAMEIREFKLSLLRRHLAGDLKSNLPPTFFNHMLNELEEYIGILNYLLCGRVPVYHPVHHHLLWLLDGSGHAASIEADLDDVEKDLKRQSREFKKTFSGLHEKALEMAGYTRTNMTEFPSLGRLNIQAESKMTEFMEFLNALKEARLSKEVLGRITPIIPDHMYREECYYLTKLSQVSAVKKPDCDPGKPRIDA
jgi:hypothetical protein